nr:biotin-dependent carboxyltransferase family protein [Neobacillus sp. Marseille-Q6967]
MTAIVKVLKPGLQTTVQDLGRYGFQRYGISPSGAMDTYSLQMANLLTGNPLEEAGLEVTLIGPRFELLSDCSLAICGGNLSPEINGKSVPMWKSVKVREGDVLTFGKCVNGARAYIGFSGGIEVPIVLGSKSTFLNGGFGGYKGRALEAGDVLYGNPVTVRNRFLHPDLVPHFENDLTVKVVLGPHVEKFTPETIEVFLTDEYTITPQSNRMGYQLNGPKLEHRARADIISDPIPFGGIQVPASGQPIILMAERQTTGGYTRIATVISDDLPKLAQAKPGDRLKFQAVRDIYTVTGTARGHCPPQADS